MKVEYNVDKLRLLAKSNQKETKKVFIKLKKSKPKDLDKFVHNLHNETFGYVDCLECANCCRSLGPRITNNDISRLSKFLKLKPAEFIETYLNLDEDNDYVFRTMPCPFLQDNNYCFVYEHRPKACREYPHTDRKKYYQILNLSVRNAETCPAVHIINQEIVEKYN